MSRQVPVGVAIQLLIVERSGRQRPRYDLVSFRLRVATLLLDRSASAGCFSPEMLIEGLVGKPNCWPTF